MRWSSQPVSMSLFLKLSVSSNLMRYSTVVLKSPLMDSSFIATTMFLKHRENTTPDKTQVSNMYLLAVSDHFETERGLTRWPPRGSRPRRNNVRTGSQQIHADRPSPPRWNNPRRFYCCGSSAPARCPSWAWTPVEWGERVRGADYRYITKPCASRKVSSTSSGFSLVIRAAMTCPLGLGMHSGVSKLMTVSPHGGSP